MENKKSLTKELPLEKTESPKSTNARKETVLRDPSTYISVTEWYDDYRGQVPLQMAAALSQTMNAHGLSFPEAYALLLGRGAVVHIGEVPPAPSVRLRDLDAFEVRRPKAGTTLPLVVHVPHSSTNVPPAYRAAFAISDRDLATELLSMTDHHTDELAAAATSLGGTVFLNHLSRLVMDPERFSDDAAEPMAVKGMGAIYVSCRDGTALRRSDFSAAERTELVAELYAPYHRALEELVNELLEEFGCCFIVDLHSFPKVALPYEDGSLARPQVCIGFDDFHDDEALRDGWAGHIRHQGLEVSFNSPFAGSLVPTRFYQGDRRVRSLMIEMRRDLYMNEQTGDKTSGFVGSLSLVTSLLGMAAERARGNAGGRRH